MGIPDIIKIGGIPYTVIQEERWQHGASNIAASCTDISTIILEKTVPTPIKEEALLHEIIEVLDKHYDLKLDHQAISALGHGLYQVIADNRLYFGS